MPLCVPDYPWTQLKFQHHFPGETPCARHLERIRWPVKLDWSTAMLGLLRRRLSIESCGISRFCVNRIGMHHTTPDQQRTKPSDTLQLSTACLILLSPEPTSPILHIASSLNPNLPHPSRFTFHSSRFTPHVSRFTPHASLFGNVK